MEQRFSLEIITEKRGSDSQWIDIFFQNCNYVADHLGLRRTFLLLVDFTYRIQLLWIVFGQIWVHPDLNKSFVIYENHVFFDLEKSNPFVQNFEPTQSCLIHINCIRKGNVVDVFDPHFNFTDISQPRINNGAKLVLAGVLEVFYRVNMFYL